MTSIVNDENFTSLVSDAKGLVLVDFWAEWCGPCRQLSPIIDEVSQLMDGKASVYKLNVDESPESASALGIRSIPTLILFKDGKKIDTKVGSMQKSAIVEWLNSNMDAA